MANLATFLKKPIDRARGKWYYKFTMIEKIREFLYDYDYSWVGSLVYDPTQMTYVEVSDDYFDDHQLALLMCIDTLEYGDDEEPEYDWAFDQAYHADGGQALTNVMIRVDDNHFQILKIKSFDENGLVPEIRCSRHWKKFLNNSDDIYEIDNNKFIEECGANFVGN